MRINSIQTYPNNNSSLKSNVASEMRFTSYRYVGQDGSNYIITRWKTSALNILNRDPSQIKDLAEFFHKSNDKTIKEASQVYLFNNPFLIIEKKNASQAAYQKLRNAVDGVLDYKDKLLRECEDLFSKDNKNKRILELNGEIDRLNLKASQVYDVFQETKTYKIPNRSSPIYIPSPHLTDYE